MSKAYDRVKWGFLEAVLQKMGFDEQLIRLFMSCISSVNYQIIHAGRTLNSINLSRVLRQGDPLSSYLFLICIEGFTALIQEYENRGLIKSIKVARNAPPITHMFFAYDCYIFGKASMENANQVLNMLKVFEKASGQQINVDKSSIFFSRNTCSQLKQELCDHLRFKEVDDNNLYLGLPNMIARKKSAIFGFIKEKLQDRLQGWDKKKLLKGGKETLIKTATQTLPNYAMSVFLLPIEVCNDLEKAMCKFWWRSDTSKDKCIHWMCWSRLCLRKSAAGMSFHNLRDFNVALLGSQAWRLLTCPNKLVSRIFKARYYPNGSFFTVNLGNNPSYIWRSVMEAQSLIKQGISCPIGNGKAIDILNTPWFPTVYDPYVHTISDALFNQKVTALMLTGEITWDVDLITDLFEARDTKIILSILLDADDKDTWFLEEAWNLKIPVKIKNFLWHAASHCLPIKDLLRLRHVDVNALCLTCNFYPETILHSLVTCSFAEMCHTNTRIPSISDEFNTFIKWLQLLFDQKKENEILIQVMVCYVLWKNQNDLVWNQRSIDALEVVNLALFILNQWRAVQDKTFDRFLGFMNHEDGLEQWHPPMINRVKVNIDAALFEEPNRYSHALVIRYHSGNLIEAISKCSLGRVSPEFAEAVGICEALSWVKNEN